MKMVHIFENEYLYKKKEENKTKNDKPYNSNDVDNKSNNATNNEKGDDEIW